MHSVLPATAQTPTSGRFRLTRFFSITSLVGIVFTTACLFWTYRQLAIEQLVEHESRANANLTQAFANAVWHRYRGLVAGASGRSRESLQSDPDVAQLRTDVLRQMRGLSIAKVKIYDTDGLTVFSTESRQIGEDNNDNAGFRQARAGQVGSQITFRENFEAFEGTLSRRNLIASYVPVRPSPQAPVEGVFEVYSDVTALLAAQQRAQWQVAGLVFGLLTLLYLFLWGVVRKADSIISMQERESAEREAQVRHQAYHDNLTGLPNRAHFALSLAQALTQARRDGRACALMFIDLDRFKSVNDSLGHAAGDDMLKAVSERIAGCLRGSDQLFRMGGDEFTVVLSQIDGPAEVDLIARRILSAIESPVTVHGQLLNVGASIGVTVHPGDGDNVETLLKRADAAMYCAKSAGRSRHVFYRSGTGDPAEEPADPKAAMPDDRQPQKA